MQQLYSGECQSEFVSHNETLRKYKCDPWPIQLFDMVN